MKTIIDKEDNRIQPFIEEFLALCEKYNIGVESGDPWYGLELFEIEDFDSYEIGIKHDFKHILKNIEETD